MASPFFLSYEHSGTRGTVGVGTFSTPEQDDWTKLTDLSSRRRVQNRIAQRNHRAMIRNRQKGNGKESSPSAPPSGKGSQRSGPARSRSVASSNGSAESPCFIHYQPPQEWFLEKPYQPEPPPTPRHSPDYIQDQYSIDMSLSNGANALGLPPNNFLFSPEVATPGEITSGGDYLSAIESIEVPYLYWDAMPEIETIRPYQTCWSPNSSKTYSSQMDTAPKTVTNIRKSPCDGIPVEIGMGREENPQIMPRTPPATYNHDHTSHYCGRTALHLAAEQANLAIIELLLQAGLDVDARDEEGQSALHVAVLEGHEASVRLLLDKGANHNLQDYDGRTALHWAAVKGNIDIITLLLDYRVAINLQDLSGRTALHHAIEEGHEAIVRMLLQRGADAKVMIDNRTFVNDYQTEYILRS